MTTTTTTMFLATSTVAALALSGCQTPPAQLEVSGAWAKAADEGMTGVFAEISNPSNQSVTIVGGESEAANRIELHEVADGVMREKPEGFALAAQSTHVLEPGADHIMLMGLNGPLEPGETVSITLELDSGDTLEVVADVRDFAAANEEYVPGHGGEE